MKLRLQWVLVFALNSATIMWGCVTLRTDVVSERCIESDCEFQCAAAPRASLADTLVPGFFTRQVQGHIVVTAILPNSPAKASGLRMGDELTAIDEMSLPLVCPMNPWQIQAYHRLSVLRNGDPITMAIRPIPMKQLWASLRTDRFVAVSLRSGLREHRVEAPFAPYISGLRVAALSGVMKVVDVTPYTPAAAAGIRIGDVILAAGTGRHYAVSDLQASDSRKTVHLKISSAGQIRELAIRFASMTEILENFATKLTVPTTLPIARIGL